MKSDEIKKIVEQTLEAAVPIFEAVLKSVSEEAAANAAKAGAEAGSKAAIEAIKRERKKAQQARYDRRLYNTKLLLRHYRMLMEYCQNAVYDVHGEIEEDMKIEDILEYMVELVHDEDLYVESIKQSVTRTCIIMKHVNKMLDIYELHCREAHREDFKRHFRAIKRRYLDPHPSTVAQIARDENVDKRTVYKDIEAACERLTSLIFGIDGIRRL